MKKVKNSRKTKEQKDFDGMWRILFTALEALTTANDVIKLQNDGNSLVAVNDAIDEIEAFLDKN